MSIQSLVTKENHPAFSFQALKYFLSTWLKNKTSKTKHLAVTDDTDLRATQLDSFGKAIYKQLKDCGNAIYYFADDADRAAFANIKSTYEEDGWRLTEVFSDECLDFVLLTLKSQIMFTVRTGDYSRTPLDMATIFEVIAVEHRNHYIRQLSFNEKDQAKLINTLTQQDFHLMEKKSGYLTFLKSDAMPVLDQSPLIPVSNNLEKQLKAFLMQIEKQVNEHGCAIKYLNNWKSRENFLQIKPALEAEHWRLTEIFYGDALDFVLLTPQSHNQFKVAIDDDARGPYNRLEIFELISVKYRREYLRQLSLDEHDQTSLIEALAKQGFQLSEKNGQYLIFAQSI